MTTTQQALNPNVGTRVYIRRGPEIHTCSVIKFNPSNKQITGRMDTDANQYGSELVHNVQFDEKAHSLSHSDLLAGKGTDNAWFPRRDEAGQSRAAGSSR